MEGTFELRSVIAKLNLAWALLLHFLKKPFRTLGYAAFLNNFRADRLIPISQVDKSWLFKFSKCLNCGLCDVVCPALQQLPPGAFPGPSYLVTTLTRSTTDFWAVSIDLSLCGGCQHCQSVCPNLVPVKEALEFIEAKALETDTIHP